MNVGQIFIIAALILLVVAIAYGFYRAGYGIGKGCVFMQRQDVNKVVAEMRVSDFEFSLSKDLRKEVYERLAYGLLPEIKKYITIEEITDFAMRESVFRGILYVGTKELKHGHEPKRYF